MKKVAIHSAPRSGSSWLGSIFDSSEQTAYRYQPLFSYGHKGQLTPSSSLSDIDKFYIDILKTEDPFVLQKDAIERGLVPKFPKTELSHIVYKEVRYHHILENLISQDKDIKVVGLVRNGLSVVNSWLNAPKEFKKELGWKIQDEWRFAPSKNLNKPEEFNGYEKWKETVFLFLKLQESYPEQCCVLNYTDLLKDSVATVKSVFAFCEIPFGASTLSFLESSGTKTNTDAYSVFKTKKEDSSWENELPDYIATAIQSDEEFQNLNRRFKWID